MGASQLDPIVLWGVAALCFALFAVMVWPALDSRRWKMAMDLSPSGLLWGGIGVLVLYRFTPLPELLPVIIVAIVVHEYGHVLAMRLAGHAAPVFQLAPFGGYAMPSQPPRNQAENAFVALMGPGFSVVLLVAALLTAEALRGVNPAGALYAWRAAVVIGLLNAFNLLPFYPLDGGKSLRAIARTGGPSAAHGATLLMCAGMAAFAIALQIWLLLIFALLGLAGAMRAAVADARTPPMGVATALLALGAHLILLALHVSVVRPDLLSLLRRLF